METTTTETTNAAPAWSDVAAASAEAEIDQKQDASKGGRDQRHRDAFEITITEMLPVKLSDARKLELGELAAKAAQQIAEFEAEKKAAVDKWKAKIEIAERERDDSLSILSEGEEVLPVECSETKDFRRGEVVKVRLDTNETLMERAMHDWERQAELPLEEPVEARTVDPEPEPAVESDIVDPTAVLGDADLPTTKVVRRRKKQE